MLFPIVFFGLMLGTAGAAAWAALGRPELMRARVAWRKQKLERAHTTAIAKCTTAGIVKISGRVEAIGALLEAPLTARSGVATLTTLDIFERRNGGDVAVPYVRDEAVSDFIVRDDSGSALVRGARAKIVATPRAVVAPEEERKQPWMRRLRASEGVLPRTLWFAEAALEPGADVTVLGRCIERGGGGDDGPYRDSGEATIVLEALVIDWHEKFDGSTPLFTEN